MLLEFVEIYSFCFAMKMGEGEEIGRLIVYIIIVIRQLFNNKTKFQMMHFFYYDNRKHEKLATS